MDVVEIRVLKGGDPVRVTRVHCEKAEVLDEDPAHPLPPLASLSTEDQIFVVAFLRSHGNIREMERRFNISYPTVKKRLNGIVAKLDEQFEAPPEDPHGDVLARLARGELTADAALALLDHVGSQPPRKEDATA